MGNPVIGVVDSSGCNQCWPGFGVDISSDSFLYAGSETEAESLSFVRCLGDLDCYVGLE